MQKQPIEKVADVTAILDDEPFEKKVAILCHALGSVVIAGVVARGYDNKLRDKILEHCQNEIVIAASITESELLKHRQPPKRRERKHMNKH